MMSKTSSKPSFDLERLARYNGHSVISGVDEVGRGPWAGPVVTAAVIIEPQLYDSALFLQVNDSKKLSPKRRDSVFDALTTTPGIHFAVGQASVAEIDELNIAQATYLAMIRAVKALTQAVSYVLVDGNKSPDFGCSAQAIIKGDQLSLSIAAASIIAKVTRDRLMVELDKSHPGYGWAQNAGYGTAVHQKTLKEQGVTPHHRRSFAPIAALLQR